jgi:hypothetical protein
MKEYLRCYLGNRRMKRNYKLQEYQDRLKFFLHPWIKTGYAKNYRLRIKEIIKSAILICYYKI